MATDMVTSPTTYKGMVILIGLDFLHFYFGILARYLSQFHWQ